MGYIVNQMVLDNLILFGAGSFLATQVAKNIKSKKIICISKSLKIKKNQHFYIFKDYKDKNLLKINKLAKGKKNTIIFFNNYTKDNLILKKSLNEIKKELNKSVLETFEYAKNFSKVMLQENHGTIIFVGSSRGIVSDVGISGYSVSKNALLGLTKSFSREFARYNITSNYLSLGFFKSPLFDSINENKKKRLLNQTDTKKFGDIKSIINAIYFLSQSRYVTGSVINIDGGFN